MDETRSRYAAMEHFIDPAFWADLFIGAGIATAETTTETIRGAYDAYQRKVTINRIPALSAVAITAEGLELTFAHEAGQSAKSWSKNLDALTAAFAADR